MVGRLLGQQPAPIEIILTVAGDAGTAAEIISTFVSFTADGLVNLEILGSLSADQAAALSSQVLQIYGVRFKGRAATATFRGRGSGPTFGGKAS